MNSLYAMDTHFFTSMGSYGFDARCEILEEIGYDATYLTLWTPGAWEDLAKLKDVKKRHGIETAAVYVTWKLSNSLDSPESARITRLAETLEGCDTIELAIVMREGQESRTVPLFPRGTSDPIGDDLAARFLDRILPICQRRGIRVLLYPHITFWLERVEDAVRLCRRIAHPNLGVVFCGYHWYAIDGKEVAAKLELAAPFLRHVNLCGSRRTWGKDGGHCTIEPLDDGELDNFALLGALRRINFDGRIGIQGYGMGGDIYTKLKRSLAACRDMTQRLDRHPEWADMQPTVPWM